MPAELPPDLRAALHQLHGEPLYLIDPETNTSYVLIPTSEHRPAYDSQCDDDELAETYPAQQASAAAAGWDEPEMSDYDNYEANRKRQTG